MKKLFWIVALGLFMTVMLPGVQPANAKTAGYHPAIDPADFSTTIDNPYFTLKPGTVYSYKGTTNEGVETNTTAVTNLVREVMGIKTLVVWDRVWLDGQLVEETYDWYAQDTQANVWYFGEESREYKNGKDVSTEGSWEGGVNGAQPGIIMKGQPKVGDAYRQEYLKGEAEDRATVLAVDASVKVAAGNFQGCVKTYEYSKLEPSLKENKYYCPAVGGVALEQGAGGERVELIATRSNDTANFVAAPPASQAAKSTASSIAGLVATFGLLVGVAAGYVLARLLHRAK